MKKLIFLLLPVIIFAKSFMISNIPLPKTYIQDLDPYKCSSECMQNYINRGMIFSFLSHANRQLSKTSQEDARVMFVSIFNLGSFNSAKKIKIALLLPYKKIGKYASSTTNATFAYLMTKSHAFMLKSYKIENENIENIKEALLKIKQDGFEYVIAPLTKAGVNSIININPDINIYFPTVNKKDIHTESEFLSFGAIDYTMQSNLLLKEAVSPLIIFSDKSSIGHQLAHHQKSEFLKPVEKEEEEETSLFSLFSSQSDTEESTDSLEDEKEVIKHFISRRTTNLELYLKDKESIKKGSFFINTPIVKSGMIMSQLTLYDTNATNVLSTQINYDPLLLSMTQYHDRKEMIIANSITQDNNVLIETNSLLDNDIVYDWINYATTVGVDYFYSLTTGDPRAYTMKIVDNQVIYDVELVKAGRSKFVSYKSASKQTEE